MATNGDTNGHAKVNGLDSGLSNGLSNGHTPTQQTTDGHALVHAEPRMVKIAACHAASVYLDATATTQKALALIDQAADNGANLVVFPEVFIPGFPLYAGTHAPVDQGTLYSQYVSACVYADGPEIAQVRAKARERGVAVSIGFSERSRASVGCVWNANVVIGESGAVLSHQRKLIATYWEKLVWAQGDGFGLQVAQTERAGRVGVLICGDNTNPLARYSLMAQAEEIHIATFPAAWPTARSGGYDLSGVNRVRGAAHAFEAKVYAVICGGYISREDKRRASAGDVEAFKVLDGAPPATTHFLGPDTADLGDTLSGTEGIAYADVDLQRCVEVKKIHDISGGTQRFDIFDLKVTRTRPEPVHWVE